jgi:hypothetical protein
MAVTRLTTNGLTGTKYDIASADNYYMEPIATSLVGSGGVSSVTFSDIPSTYKHLQIRGIVLSSSPNNDIVGRFNSDSGSNYSLHALSGNGTSASAYATAPSTYATLGYTGDTTGPGAFIFDILDYANTTKFKTTRSLNGNDSNTVSRYVNLLSSSWRNTSAINSITIIHGAAVNFNQHSRFSLYGIKG